MLIQIANCEIEVEKPKIITPYVFKTNCITINPTMVETIWKINADIKLDLVSCEFLNFASNSN